MAANEVSVFKKNIESVIGNPAGMQRICLSQLDQMLNGEINIVDPSNPFVFLLETATIMSAVAIEQNAISNRKQYPSVAVSEEDVYLHMSDVDYINRFAKPATAKFNLLLNLNEVNGAMVTDPNDSNIKKIVIPRHTEFTVADHKFTMQYPIEIRKLVHGGLQIVFDVSKPSPLLTLSSNIVKWFTTNIDGNDYIVMEMPIEQIEIKEYNAPLNVSAGFVKTYLLTDQYYYARAFISGDVEGTWDEVYTTHSDQIFDPTKVTVLLKVFSDSLKVEIPTIYFSNGMVGGKRLRLDIYTTKGPVDLILSNYVSNQFSVKWTDLENDDNGIFTAPIKTFKSMGVYSTDSVVGGGNSIDFATLRDRVINNAIGAPNIPITDTQLVATLNDLEFSVVKNIDNITDRQYLATREIPNAVDTLRGVTDISLLSNVSNSPISTAIKTIETTLDSLKNLYNVYDNNTRITIGSKTLFLDNGGIVGPVSNEQMDALNAYTKEKLIDVVNFYKYSYSPFYYVLDTNNGSFALRPYHLDKPKAISKVFLEENDNLLLSVSIGKYTIEKVPEGYRLYLVTSSSADFKTFYTDHPSDIHLLVGFKPTNSASRAYINATIKDPEVIYGTGQTIVPEGELLFESMIITNYDIDSKDSIYVTNFQISNATDRVLGSPLTVEMDYMFYVTNYDMPSVARGDLDTELGECDWLYSCNISLARGLVKERITLELGRSLKYLWSNSRTILGTEAYKRYDVDVPKVYTEDVYEIDPVTGLKKMTIVDGAVTFNKLHSVNDPYLDGNGDPIIEHHQGDPILDINGDLIPVDQRKVTRHIDLCLFDGTYYFVDETTNVLYREEVPNVIVGWLDNDISDINSRMLERSVVYFYPKTTFGTAKIIVENGIIVNTYSEQSFAVKVYLPSAVFYNDSLKSSISKDIIDTIADALKKNVVSLTDIQYTIKTILGDLIKGIEISGFGEDKSISTFTVYDDTIRASIKKNAVLLTESTISIKDDVNITFIKHEL